MSKKLLSKKVIAIVATMSLVSVPLVAKPIMKKITAYLNPTITYIYDGKEILDDVNSITYGNKTYIPVSEFAKALGKDVRYKNGKIIITSKVEDVKQIIIDKAVIKEIDKQNNQVTILPAGRKDSYENYIILNVGSDTFLRHEKLKKIVVLDDLEVGMEVKVAHSLVSTSSLPPQTNAFEMMIYANSGTVTIPDEENHKVSMGTVKEVDVQGNQVTILPAGQKDSYENYIVLNVSDKTLLKNEKQGKLLNLKDLTVGMKVKAVHSQIATFSLPPQTPTYKIIVIDQWETDDDKDDYELEDAVITQINHAEKYLIVVEGGKEYKVIFTNKTKVEYEKENKKPNVNSLKVGNVVDIEVEDGVAEEIEVQN